MELQTEVGVAKRRGNGNGSKRGNGDPPENGGTRKRTLREIIENVERRVLMIEDGVFHLRKSVAAHERRLKRLETGT